MHLSKSSGVKLCVIIGAVLLPGLFWLGNNLAREFSLTKGNASVPAKRDRPESGGVHQWKPGDQSVSGKGPTLFTSDELVAVYESRGVAAALEAATGMTGPERASQVLFMMSYLARIDPEFVAGELKGAGLDTGHQWHVVNAVMENWKDGKKALEWATSGFTGDLLKTAVGGALRILVRTDPDAALAYLETLPASGSRDQAISDIFVAWGGFNPTAALKLLSGNFPTDDRSSAMNCVITGWSWKHPAEAAAWVAAVQDEALRARLVRDVVRSWKSKSPIEAAAWVESLPEGPGKEAGKAVAHEQVITTIDGFGAYQGPDVSWKTKTVATMGSSDFWNWAIQDPEGTRKFLETAPEGKGLTDLAAATAYQISTKEGHESAFEWAQTLQGEAGKSALRSAVISWAGSDPATAAKKLDAIEPGQRAPLVTALAENWTRNDPAAAAAWVAAYHGTDQNLLVREVLQQWTDSQPREAYAWLGTLPMGPGRDEGINYLMRRESSSDPQSVLPWIELLSEPRLRERMRLDLEGYLKADRKKLSW